MVRIVQIQLLPLYLKISFFCGTAPRLRTLDGGRAHRGQRDQMVNDGLWTQSEESLRDRVQKGNNGSGKALYKAAVPWRLDQSITISGSDPSSSIVRSLSINKEERHSRVPRLSDTRYSAKGIKGK